MITRGELRDSIGWLSRPVDGQKIANRFDQAAGK